MRLHRAANFGEVGDGCFRQRGVDDHCRNRSVPGVENHTGDCAFTVGVISQKAEDKCGVWQGGEIKRAEQSDVLRRGASGHLRPCDRGVGEVSEVHAGLRRVAQRPVSQSAAIGIHRAEEFGEVVVGIRRCSDGDHRCRPGAGAGFTAWAGDGAIAGNVRVCGIVDCDLGKGLGAVSGGVGGDGTDLADAFGGKRGRIVTLRAERDRSAIHE